jgi:hypothetical protein
MPYIRTVEAYQDIISDIVVDLCRKSIRLMIFRNELPVRVKVNKYISDLSESEIKLLDDYAELAREYHSNYCNLPLIESIGINYELKNKMSKISSDITLIVNKDVILYNRPYNKNPNKDFLVESENIVDIQYNEQLNEAVVTEYVDTVNVPLSVAMPRVVASESLRQGQTMLTQRRLGNSSPQHDCKELGVDWRTIQQELREAYADPVMVTLFGGGKGSQPDVIEPTTDGEIDTLNDKAQKGGQVRDTSTSLDNKGNKIYKK